MKTKHNGSGRTHRTLWVIEMLDPGPQGWLPIETAYWTKKKATTEMKAWKPNGRRLRIVRYVPAK